MKPKILLTQQIHQAGIDLLEKEAQVIIASGTDEETIIKEIKGCDAVIVRNQSLTKEMILAAPNLKVIGRHGVGFDNIAVETASEKGIPVVYTPATNNISVAEQAIGLLLAITKKIPQADYRLKELNDFEYRVKVRTIELYEKTMGLIGFGQIARYVAQICKNGFKMNVIAYDKYISSETAAKYGVTLVENLDDLYAPADFISIHVPSNSETNNLISHAALKKMKKSAILVNTARGPIVDEPALIKALQEGEIAGAALDVFNPEPPVADNPLLFMSNVVLSPHMAAHSEEGLRRMAMRASQGVLDVLAGRKPEFVVNSHLFD